MGIFITPLWSEYIVSADQGGIFMDHFNVYSDIQARTGGEIYIGVVGPVRTGKSTFIKRFMELLVLPGLEDVHARERARDELPQSSAGKTIMTTEPKFIPKEAAKLSLGDGVEVRVRLIDWWRALPVILKMRKNAWCGRRGMRRRSHLQRQLSWEHARSSRIIRRSGLWLRRTAVSGS